MPTLTLDDVTIAYDQVGDPAGDPVVLIAGCGQPAIAWQVGVVPALTELGYRVVTYDNRGVAPSSSPPAPYSVADVVADALGSCNPPTSWEKAITTVERDLARLDYDLPPLFYATETLRYFPIKDLQDDSLVDTFLGFMGDQEPWPNPGRLGQYEACLAWSTNPNHGDAWSQITVPCLIMAYEHDVDSPPKRAREAAAVIPDARYVELADTSHLAPFTHGAAVADALNEFFRST
jgi:pimeloyl-ACP methyl ester carboxylesterase